MPVVDSFPAGRERSGMSWPCPPGGSLPLPGGRAREFFPFPATILRPAGAAVWTCPNRWAPAGHSAAPIRYASQYGAERFSGAGRRAETGSHRKRKQEQTYAIRGEVFAGLGHAHGLRARHFIWGAWFCAPARTQYTPEIRKSGHRRPDGQNRSPHHRARARRRQN